MQTRSLDHVSVWLDGSPSDESVFPQAMDWALRLHLPLRAVVTASRSKQFANHVNHLEEIDRSHGPIVEKMKTLGVACTQHGIVLEMFLSLEIDNGAMDQFLRPCGLCLFGENTSSPVQHELLVRSARNHEIAVLMCAPICAPMTRIMVLHHQTNANGVYLENVARLCRALETHPIVLIVADTEREADLRQGYAEAVCKSFRLLADFDFVVGSDLRSAVRRVTAWRSCSHMIIQRGSTAPWWHFTNGDLLEQLHGLSDTLSILGLPEALVFDAPRQIRGNPMKFPVSGDNETNTKSNKEYV